jgi:prolyl 4-hydroxylase
MLAKAEAGDVQAQYDLAAEYHRIGKYELSTEWLSRAADGGHPLANYTWSAVTLANMADAEKLNLAIKRLRSAASAEITPAIALLALCTAYGLDAPPDWRRALQLQVLAAMRGDPASMRVLACLRAMALGTNPKSDGLLGLAANNADAIAQFLLKDRRETAAQNWEPDWAAYEAIVVEVDGRSQKPVEQISQRPNIRLIRNFMTEWECGYLIRRAAPMEAPSMTFDVKSGATRIDPHRTSKTAIFSIAAEDLVIRRLCERMAAAAECPASHAEPLNVLQYEVGQQYRPHFDFFDGPDAQSLDYVRQGGQRIKTLLVNLNHGYEGGETAFLATGQKLKGRTGDAMIFDNVDDRFAPDRSTLHAGLPVKSGVKWLGSVWYRQYPVRAQWGLVQKNLEFSKISTAQS